MLCFLLHLHRFLILSLVYLSPQVWNTTKNLAMPFRHLSPVLQSPTFITSKYGRFLEGKTSSIFELGHLCKSSGDFTLYSGSFWPISPDFCVAAELRKCSVRKSSCTFEIFQLSSLSHHSCRESLKVLLLSLFPSLGSD